MASVREELLARLAEAEALLRAIHDQVGGDRSRQLFFDDLDKTRVRAVFKVGSVKVVAVRDLEHGGDDTEELVLVCPYCQAEVDPEEIRYVETIGCARQVQRLEHGPEPDDAFTLIVNGYYVTEGFDEGSEDERLECPSCMKEFAIPEDVDLEFV